LATYRRLESPQAWFTPREPDQAVRHWSRALLHSGRRRVLDVGCGGGRHVVYLARQGLSVVAGDRSADALAQTARWLDRESLAATLLLLEMTRLPFEDGTFDAALSVNVLHHAEPAKARAAVQEIWRVLRPGGLFLAVLASPSGCQCLLERPARSGDFHVPCPPALEARPSLCYEHDLHELFAGFHILSTQRHRPQLPGGTRPSGWRAVNWRIWAERPCP
jgi:SAM-dependent methyltransferase